MYIESMRSNFLKEFFIMSQCAAKKYVRKIQKIIIYIFSIFVIFLKQTEYQKFRKKIDIKIFSTKNSF